MSAIYYFFMDRFRREAAEELEWGPYALEDTIVLGDEKDAMPEDKAELRKLNGLTPRQSRRVRVRKERALAAAQAKAEPSS